ncbi:ROK family protein, partial [Staphylococcus succinus]
MLKICVDIGGTKTIVGLINEDLKIIDSKKFETNKVDPTAQFNEILKIAKQYV